MEEFNEFYFSTGLYNYYIEAYPEAHPVYKPLLSFMQDGNKNLGLRQLDHAINHTVFLKVEAMLFMSLIQLKYEDDLNTAAIYAERLNNEYPRNIFYQGHLVTILLHQHRYSQVDRTVASMKSQKDLYSSMIRSLSEGFMAEKRFRNPKQAGRAYQETVRTAEKIGPFADLFKAMAYMGLSRLHEKKGLNGEARRYAKKAARLTTYRFILEE